MGAAGSKMTPAAPSERKAEVSERRDLRPVRRAIAALIHDREHDDGSYAPLLIRFSWHQCGTFDRHKGNGGSAGCTFRFAAEAGDPENAGLDKARRLLEPVKEQFPWLSRADLYVLAGTVAIQAAGGPFIPFRTGRPDWTEEEAQSVHGPSGCPFGDGAFNPHKSRLPAADLGPAPDVDSSAPVTEREAPTIDAVRSTFARMGFDDKETVCLIVLGHQFGRCHPDVSGFENPWYAFAPSEWNVYEHGLGYLSVYTMAIEEYREVTTSAGKRQFENFFAGQRWMMLVSDMVLHWDPEYRSHLQFYDRNRKAFKHDAVAAWTKLIELGCEDIGLVSEI